MIIAVKIVFSLATLAFIAGLRVRRSNNQLHKRFMILGFILTLSIAMILIAGVHLFNQTYGPAQWLVEISGGINQAKNVLIAHRVFSTIALLFLVTQVITGIVKNPLHRVLVKFVIPFWSISFFTGLVIFV